MANIPFLNNAYFAAKVGIGTISPDSKLSVTSTTLNSEDIIYLKSGADNVNDYLGIAWELGVGGNGPHSAIRSFAGPSGSDARLGFLTTSDGGTTLTEGLSVAHNGNVGIGTTSPARLLSVNGIQGWSASGTEKAAINPTSTGTDFTLVGDNGNIRFDSRPSGNSYVGTGNFGIGTTSPVSVLEVYGGSSGVNDVDRYVRFKASNGEKRFDFYMGGTGNASSLGMYTSDGTTKNVQISSGGTSYLNGGNVGIGTTSPSEKLEVDGIIKVVHTDSTYAKYRGQGVFFSRSNSYLAPEQDNFASLLIGYNGGRWGNVEINGAFIKFENGANERMRIDSSGNVGIGTTSPSSIFAISNNAPVITATSTNNSSGLRYNVAGTAQTAHRFQYNGSTLMTIRNTGNVGIATESPTEKLHVTGNARVTGAYYDSNNSPGTSGQILSSTVTGTDWVSGSGLPGGPYLPLSAGSSYPLTGDLAMNNNIVLSPKIVQGHLEIY